MIFIGNYARNIICSRIERTIMWPSAKIWNKNIRMPRARSRHLKMICVWHCSESPICSKRWKREMRIMMHPVIGKLSFNCPWSIFYHSEFHICNNKNCLPQWLEWYVWGFPIWVISNIGTSCTKQKCNKWHPRWRRIHFKVTGQWFCVLLAFNRNQQEMAEWNNCRHSSSTLTQCLIMPFIIIVPHQ